MRAFVIIVVAAILGFFGYEFAANGRTPVEAVKGLVGIAAEVADDAAGAATDAADAAAAATATRTSYGY